MCCEHLCTAFGSYRCKHVCTQKFMHLQIAVHTFGSPFQQSVMRFLRISGQLSGISGRCIIVKEGSSRGGGVGKEPCID